MMLTHRHAVLLMVVVTVLWSTAGVVTRHLEQARQFEVTFWRSFFTLLTLLVLLPLWRGRDVFRRMRDGGLALWLSGLCWAGMFTFFMIALTLTQVANVLLTMALGPLFTALASRAFLSHKLPWRTWMAITAAGAGIVWMFSDQAQGLGAVTTLVALGVPLSGAANWTVTQHAHAQGHDVDLVPAVLIGAIISSVLTLPLAWPLQASGHDLLLLAGLGVFQLAIPCVLAVVCTRYLVAAEISLLGLLEVLFGILLAWVGAGEVPSARVLCGGSLVMGALLVNAWLGWRDQDHELAIA